MPMNANFAPRPRAILATLLVLVATLQAGELAEVFQDHMVLQRDARVCIWGRGTPGEKVVVSFAGQTAAATVDTSGQWRAFLDPMAASVEPRALVVRGRNTREVRDVLVGEVWLAGGQSNMGSRMQEYAETVGAEFPQANYPGFRVFTVPKRRLSGEAAPPEDRLVVSPRTVGQISAAAYFFGRDLHRHLGVPVGIVVCAWGGTLAENWVSRGTLLAHPETRPIIERYDRLVAGYRSEADYERNLAEHRAALAAWRAKPKGPARIGPAPKEPMGRGHFQRPGGLYETMFVTVAPYTFRGILFYQGESNVADGRSYQYRHLLPMLVKEWRRDLGAELPFLNVQLPVIKGQHDDEWAEMRESQLVGARAVPGCKTAVVVEYGEYNRLHPHLKEGVGARLAVLARGAVYGEKIVFRGPTLRHHRIEGRRMRLEFDSGGSGLVARGGELKDFVVADAAGRFAPARAYIEGDTVVVWSDEVAQPVAVRYGWRNFFAPTLFNREGFSASPFRTDTFRLKTEENR
jgi:hypothetical protein